MAHELEIRNGQASMFSLKIDGPPWHNLGRTLDDAPTAKEAIIHAGLAYEILSLPTFVRLPDGSELEIPDRKVNLRADTREVMGYVSGGYTPFQNWACFEFLDSLVAQGEMRYHTAGALGRGERIWMLGKMPGHIRVKGTDDVTDQYLLLFNGHNGASSLRCLFTPIRVVCHNTLTAALQNGANSGVTLNHVGNLADKIEEARKVLGLASDYFTGFGEGADLLASRKPTTEQLESYFASLWPKGENGTKNRTRHMALFGLFERGAGQDMPGIAGTWWAAYNAVTQLTDHVIGNQNTRHLAEMWTGGLARCKRKAWDNAVFMAEHPETGQLQEATEDPEAAPDADSDDSGGVATVTAAAVKARKKGKAGPSAN
jgi:phage/plasmid-like protein (TIGR03299 family)